MSIEPILWLPPIMALTKTALTIYAHGFSMADFINLSRDGRQVLCLGMD